METNADMELTKRVFDLEKSVDVLNSKLARALKKLRRAEKRLDRRRVMDEDLRLQVESLGRKLHEVCSRSSKAANGDAAVQADPTQSSETTGAVTMVTSWAGVALPLSVQAHSIANEDPSLPQPPTSLAEDLRQTAEAAMLQSGFVYDPSSGFYYDHSSGLYYDAGTQLYYDQKTGSYYYYNQKSHEYVFHSQLDAAQLESYYGQCAPSDSREQIASRPRKGGRRKSKPLLPVQKQAKQAESSQLHRNADGVELDVSSHDEVNAGIKNLDTGAANGEMEVAASGTCLDADDIDVDKEDGELSESGGEGSSGDSLSSLESEVMDNAMQKNADSAAVVTGWPPCIRAIILKSASLKEGSLHVITYPGGTIGRERDLGHVIVLPDIAVSKTHAEILYDATEKGFYIQDCGSANGTYVNGHRVCMREDKDAAEGDTVSSGHREAAAEDDSCSGRTALTKLRLSHRDVVQFATCEVLVHIHPSMDTCDDCEPGIVQAHLSAAAAAVPAADNSAAAECLIGSDKKSREANRRKLLKSIKQKYGLEKEAFQSPRLKADGKYSDRAELRRQVVGSDNPHEQERPSAASSVDRAISPDNKGHKLLQKLGWKSGDLLGRDGEGGLAEPIKATIRLNAAAGLGANTAAEASLDDGGHTATLTAKARVRLKTLERFEQLERQALLTALHNEGVDGGAP